MNTSPPRNRSTTNSAIEPSNRSCATLRVVYLGRSTCHAIGGRGDQATRIPDYSVVLSNLPRFASNFRCSDLTACPPKFEPSYSKVVPPRAPIEGFDHCTLILYNVHCILSIRAIYCTKYTTHCHCIRCTKWLRAGACDGGQAEPQPPSLEPSIADVLDR